MAALLENIYVKITRLPNIVMPCDWVLDKFLAYTKLAQFKLWLSQCSFNCAIKLVTMLLICDWICETRP